MLQCNNNNNREIVGDVRCNQRPAASEIIGGGGV